MFNKDRFIVDCRAAVADGQTAVREVLAAALTEPARIIAEFGEPEQAGISPIYRAPNLTIINFVWAPCMTLLPHNHHMFAVIGIYTGREDNIFWRRTPDGIEAAGAKSLGTGDIGTLGRDIIHSVLNPIGKMTCAIHVYGGDFFDPPVERSEWDHETLQERPWNIDRTKRQFQLAQARFAAVHES